VWLYSLRSPDLFYLLTAGVEVVYFHLITLRHTPQWVGLLWTRDRPGAETSSWQHKHSQETNSHVPGGIRTHDPSKRSATDQRRKPLGHWDRPCDCILWNKFQNFWFLDVRFSQQFSKDWGLLGYFFLSTLTLKMKAQRSFETLIIIYQSGRRNIPWDFNFQFPINIARFVVAVRRNIPVWTQRVGYCSVPKAPQFRIVMYRVWRDRKGRRNLLFRLTNVWQIELRCGVT
jgi:hypothetical protein